MELTAPTNVNLFTVVDGDLALEALTDNIIVLEDPFRTGYECKTCDGEARSKDTCVACSGKKYEQPRIGVGDTTQVPCRVCEATGLAPCPDCGGKGGLLVVPESVMTRPSSGKITSCGPDVKALKVGDRVLYSNYAGNAINFKQAGVARTMHEHEVMIKMHGVGKIGDRIK